MNKYTVNITQDDIDAHWRHRHRPRECPEAAALRRASGLARVGVGPFSAWICLQEKTSELDGEVLWADLPKAAVAFVEQIRLGKEPSPATFTLSFS